MKNLKKITIFNLVIFGIIGVLGTIMLFKVSYARYLSNNDNTDYWDGSSVSSTLSGRGTSSSPYLISNGADLKLFINRCNSSSSYRSKYYKLTANIYLNEGYFDYSDENNLKYYKDNQEYLISGNKYYSTVQDILDNNPAGTINQLPRSDFTFTGSFDGGSYSINGLFYYNNTYYENYGFIRDATNTSSSTTFIFKNINFLNTCIVSRASNLGIIGKICSPTEFDYNVVGKSSVTGVTFTGIIKNISGDEFYENYSVSSSSQNKINLASVDVSASDFQQCYKYIVTGTASASFMYGGSTYNSGSFSIVLTSPVTTITVTPVSSNVTFTNLSYKGYYHEDHTGLIGFMNSRGTFEHIIVRGKIVGQGIAGGEFGRISISRNPSCNGTVVIRKVYNLATIISNDVAGGIVGIVFQICDIDEFSLSYNYSDIYCSRFSGGLIGYISYASCITNMSSCFDFQKNTTNSISGRIIGYFQYDTTYNFNTCFSGSKVYYVSGSGNPIGNVSNILATSVGISSKTKSNLVSESNLGDMGFKKNGAGSQGSGYIWVYQTSLPPLLYTDDYTSPTVSLVIGSNSWTGLNSISRVRLTSDTAVIINANDNKDLAKIEYYIRDGFSNSYSGYDNFQYSFYDGSNLNIELNDCKTIFVKATDVYGNITYANSDLIVYDGYETSFTEGINDYPLDFYNGQQVTKDSVLNFNCTHQMDVSIYSSWYSTSARTNLYIYEEPLPIDTKIVLYDDFYDQTYMYTVNSTPTANTNSDDDTYYVYNLANFRSIVNNTAYDNKVSSHHSNGVLNENYKISFDFSDVDDDDFPIYIEPELVAVASGVSEYEGASYFAYSVYNSLSHINYNLDVSEEDDGDSISLVGPDNYAHF